MKRRDFIYKTILGVSLSGLSLRLVACGGDSDDDGGSSDGCSSSAASSSIGTNHGHTITVSADDIAAGVQKDYSIQGTGTHDHTVTVEASHFSTLSSGGSVTITSSTDNSHSHEVTVSCA